MKIQKIINDNSKLFEKWDRQLQEHYQSTFQVGKFNETEETKLFYQTNELLYDIAKNFFKYGNFKDEWDNSKCYMNVGGQNLIIKSLKTNHTFHFGVENDEFYLNAYFMYPENIRHMKDDFWQTILGLKKYGNFKFVENSGINSKEKKFFENKTSDVFRIIRNYILFQVETMNTTDYQRSPDMDLGWLEIRWKFDTDWGTLIENTCKSFKDIYKLNYQLWKITDLKNKKYARQQNV